MTAPGSDDVEALRQRLLAAPYPLGRGCCGADNATDCHQRGICWMQGTHPDSPSYIAGSVPDQLEEVPGPAAARVELANIRRLVEKHGVAPADGNGELRSTVAMVEELALRRPGA